MPFQAWILRQQAVEGDADDLLQWGHALSGMDMLHQQSQQAVQSRLQWGHALSGMDIDEQLTYLIDGIVLQWGHALSGMDILLGMGSERQFQRLQWGHALSGMDIPQYHIPMCICPGFNGAMPFQAWIYRHAG